MLEIEAHGEHGMFRGAKATGPPLKRFPVSLKSPHPRAGELQVSSSRTIFPPHKLSRQVTRLRVLSFSLSAALKRTMWPERDRTIGALLTNPKENPTGDHTVPHHSLRSQSEFTWSALPQSSARRSALTARELGQTTASFRLGTILCHCASRSPVGACA